MDIVAKRCVLLRDNKKQQACLSKSPLIHCFLLELSLLFVEWKELTTILTEMKQTTALYSRRLK